MTTALVTGSEGNIGRYLVRALVARHPDWRILRVSRRPPSPEASAEPGVLWRGDLADAVFVKTIFARERVDYVFHGASTSYHHAGYSRSSFSTVRNDATMALALLEAAKDVRKFVYLSSGIVYEHATEFPLVETATARLPAPSSSYGLAKFLGEKALELAQKEFGIPFTTWRLFNVVSPLEPHDPPGGHVFVDFYRKLFVERLPSLTVMGTGRQVRCFLWVEDTVDCIVDHLESSVTNNQIYNLAGEEPRTLIELKDMLLSLGKELGLLDPGYDPEVVPGARFEGVESERRIPSIDKLKSGLGWSTRTTFKECFRQFIQERGRRDRRDL